MVRAFPSYDCSEVLLDSGQPYGDVNLSEATSSVSPVPSVSLANGVEMPFLGLGRGKKARQHTFIDVNKEELKKSRRKGVAHIGDFLVHALEDNATAPVLMEYELLSLRKNRTTHSGGYYHDVVVHALRDCGYRMIDTARRYGIERELGIAWKESGVPRELLFLCSKLWPTDFGSGTKPAFELSCEKLQTDYLDLYMTHFPVVPEHLGNARSVREETWRQMELLYDEGKIRAIGVSNYAEDDLAELLEYCSVAPHVNQCEFHPWYDPRDLRRFCAETHILYTGYCPIAKGKFLDADVLQKLSSIHRKTPAQICLRWSLEHGVPVIPKSKEKHRVAENRDIFDFSLSANDMRELETLQRCPKKLVRFDDLPNKFDLPDGYKLGGRVFGLPCGLLSMGHDTARNEGACFPQNVR